eukprot:5239454-Ditylum_brightwellii.AAC.1
MFNTQMIAFHQEMTRQFEKFKITQNTDRENCNTSEIITQLLYTTEPDMDVEVSAEEWWSTKSPYHLEFIPWKRKIKT